MANDTMPIFVVAWALTIVCGILRPQRFANSFLLLFSLLVSLVFVSDFLPDTIRPLFLLGIFLVIMIALMLTPLLLILNGIHMIRKESLAPAHLLSLALGLFVGLGELTGVFYVFSIGENLNLGHLNRWVMFVTLTVFYFSFLVLSFVIYCLFIQILPHRMDLDYIIVHGSGLVDGKRLTKLLSNRVDKAIEVYKRCKHAPIIIVSGGRGDDEAVSEAQAMGDYLLAHSIPKEHIILEDQSATTRENLSNSKAIIDARDGGKRTALVSSNYHIYRCLRISRELDLSCIGIGADVAAYYWPSALIREFIAVFLTRRFFVCALIGYIIFISVPLLAMTT